MKILQFAISNKEELLSTNDDINHCSFVYGNTGINGNTKINAVSLDMLFENKCIENIGYIHLDVEGMEYKIIQGAESIIDKCRPVISFEQHLEIDNYSIIQSHLINKNYIVYLVDEILQGCRHDCRNSFAFPKELYDDTIIQKINNHIGRNILIIPP